MRICACLLHASSTKNLDQCELYSQFLDLHAPFHTMTVAIQAHEYFLVAKRSLVFCSSRSPAVEFTKTNCPLNEN